MGKAKERKNQNPILASYPTKIFAAMTIGLMLAAGMFAIASPANSQENGNKTNLPDDCDRYSCEKFIRQIFHHPKPNPKSMDAGSAVFPGVIQNPKWHNPLLFSNLTPATAAGTREPKLLYKMKGHGGTVKSLAFSPDSKTVVSGGGENDATIRLWDVSKGKARGIISRAHRGTIHAVLVSPNGQTLASGSSDTTLNLWDLRTNRFTRTFIAHTGVILALAVTADSKMLVSAATDGVRVWDLLHQRSLGALVQFDNYLHAVTLSPDGKLAATGDRNGVVKLWNLGTGREQWRLSAHTQTVTGVAFTPNGEKLVTTSRDRNIKIWDLTTGKLLRTLTAHHNSVNAIAVHPGGEILASAGRDGIKIWNLQTGELLASLYEHQDWVSAIAFSPNGKYLASGGFDKLVYVWEIQGN